MTKTNPFWVICASWSGNTAAAFLLPRAALSWSAMPASFSKERLWTCRLSPFEEDSDVLKLDLVAKIFAVGLQMTLTRDETIDLWQPLFQMLLKPSWMQYVTDWVAFSMGGHFVTEAGVQDGIPADHCWFDDIDEPEALADQRDSDWEDCTDDDEQYDDPADDPADDEYDPHQDGTMSEDDALPDFVQEPRSQRFSALPNQPLSHTPVHNAAELPMYFATHIQLFFFPEQDPDYMNVDEVEDVRDATHVVSDLVAMRNLVPSEYNSPGFQRNLQRSGLLDMLHEVCRAGNLLETSHPVVEGSFRWYSWRTSYAEMICRWVAPTITQEEYDRTLPQSDPNYQFTLVDAEQLLSFMSSNPRILPWSFNPMAAYMFFFLFHAFRRTATPGWYPRINGWNSKIVYRRLMEHGVFLEPKAHQSFLNSLEGRFSTIIQETSEHRTFLQKVSRQLLWTPMPKPTGDWDGYDSDASDHASSAVSDLTEDEAQPVKLSKNMRRRLNSKVGGVRFKAFSKNTLARLAENHRRVKVRAMRRRKEMQEWAHGTMTGTGSHQASGGYDGDIYGAFDCHSGITPEDIKAVIRHGVDADVLVEAANTIYPQMKTEMSSLTYAAALNYLGRYGVSSFYCTNYISCMHNDLDTDNQDPCMQITKSGCGKDSYNFAYVQWGIALQTRSNTVWVFNGRHVHGTIMPRQSEVINAAQSLGEHDTIRDRDVTCATALRNVRGGYNLRPRVA
ncbi:hypothetical protein C8R43DRAFT_1120802 [Mycena crocata]|nr:hypothetical protein C8R43DRAFT_1120802 [Mycena crocata]